MEGTQHSLEMVVRDYECDYQGIVNNATYLNYLEHARSTWAKELGLLAVEIYQQGIVWVLSEVNIKYRQSLQAGNLFRIDSKAYNKGAMRIMFEQEIIHIPSGALAASATVTTACLIEGRVAPFPSHITDKL